MHFYSVTSLLYTSAYDTAAAAAAAPMRAALTPVLPAAEYGLPE